MTSWTLILRHCGGGPLVGPKAQLFPKMRFEGSPNMLCKLNKEVGICPFFDTVVTVDVLLLMIFLSFCLMFH